MQRFGIEGFKDLYWGANLMTRPGNRRSRPHSRPPPRMTHPPHPPHPSQSPLFQWWNRFKKLILGGGALAAAITACLALAVAVLPKHPQEKVAHFISVQALSPVPLSEYPQRSAVFKLQSTGHLEKHGLRLVAAAVGQSSPSSVRGAADTSPPTPSPTVIQPTPSFTAPASTGAAPTPTGAAPTPTGTAPASTGAVPTPTGTAPTPTGASSSACTASPTGPTSSACTASPTGAASSAGTAAPTGGIAYLSPAGLSPHAAIAYANKVAAIVQALDPTLALPRCGGSGCTVYMEGHCINQFGQTLSPRKCARNNAALFGSGELVPVGSGGSGGGSSGGSGGGRSGTKWQPVGELVSVDLELAGLQGQRVLLSWSIFQKGGQGHLSGKWLGNFVAYSLQATTNDDTGTLAMWIPLPRQRGPYFVRLTLTNGSESLASKTSGPFD